MITQEQENEIREKAIVEKISATPVEYVATFGDYCGYGATPGDAISHLLIDIEYAENEAE